MNNKEEKEKMSYIIVEPLSIKVRRFIEKMTGNKDAKVTKFDDNHRKMFNASHGIIEKQEDEQRNTLPPIIR